MDSLLDFGYLGIILFLVLTGCGMPIPEEVAIIFAGVVSAQGHLRPELAVAACLIGALLGDSIMYAVGYRYGHRLMSEHPKLGKFVGAEREEYFERAIQRHGFKVMLLSRFMVGVRGPVYLAAGVIRMPYRRFILWDFICASLVVGTFFTLSYLYGRKIGEFIRDAEVTFTLIIGLIALIIGLGWWRRRKRNLLEETLDLDETNASLPAMTDDAASPQHGNGEVA